MIRITKKHLEKITEMTKDVELFKVINGYLIKGCCDSIKERLCEDDQVEYRGYVESGTELINLFYELKELESQSKQLEENGGRIENDVISFIRVAKTKAYESKEIKMSVVSFRNLISKVQAIMNSNNLKSIEDIKEFYGKLDSVSEEAKALETYIDLYSDHCFTFVLHKYDMILNDQRTSVRKWSFYDWNDIDLRVFYELCKEFRILL
jgi:hypothetical protein